MSEIDIVEGLFGRTYDGGSWFDGLSREAARLRECNHRLAARNVLLTALAEAVKRWDGARGAAEDAEACRLLHNAYVEYVRGDDNEG